jgi:N-methylhydantoinase B
VGADVAWIPYGADQLTGVVNSACGHIPALGVEGGLPGAGTLCERIEGLDIRRDWFEAGRIPRAADVPDGLRMPTKIAHAVLKADDIWRMRLPGGGGYGDPLERDPALVVSDVRLGAVSPHQAAAAYGVVLNAAAEGFDAERTRAQRDRVRSERKAAAVPASRPRRAGPTTCAHCGAGREASDWLVRTTPLSQAMARVDVFVDPYDGVILDEVICPACGALAEATHSAPKAPPQIDGAVLARVI